MTDSNFQKSENSDEWQRVAERLADALDTMQHFGSCDDPLCCKRCVTEVPRVEAVLAEFHELKGNQ
jgi:hypothetical protein